VKSSKRNITVLKQICNLIPSHLVQKLARKHSVDKKSRTFSPWSHVVTLLHVQLSHALSINDVCDTLENHAGALLDIRGATPPKRNTLSYANRNRDPQMAEDLFWEVFVHLQSLKSDFGFGHKYAAVPWRFKRLINAVDSTTIKLFVNCIDWARHRRRKAAAKMHLSLNLQSFLPRVVRVKSAKGHDSGEASRLCACLEAGEIAIFDKAYIVWAFLFELTKREVFWVTRAKDNMDYETVGQHAVSKGRIIRDDLIRLRGVKASQDYPKELRLVEADIMVNKEMRRMTFITNNFEWAASSICDLYKSRWAIELFFKQIKQTLQVADFLGYNENAVRWQVWIALLAYILLRFLGHVSAWGYSFNRLFTLLRGILWSRLDVMDTLKSCGTACGNSRMRAAPENAYLPGLAPGWACVI
jgi:Transposase DDE domain/Domain of unknown function (DUF4372)